jgi:glycosyltransferase involved in cell wall biosynthesis
LEADLVHAPSLAVPPARALPLVVTVHDLAFLTHPDCFPRWGRSFHEQGLALTREEAAAVVVPSAATAADVVEMGGVDKERVHVVPHGVTLGRDAAPAGVAARLARLGVAGEEAAPYLLFVGTLEPRKGLDVLLAAHALLRKSHPNLRLVVAGPKGWGPAPDLDRPGVLAAGQVDEAELDALYRGAVLLAVPSLTEGFGLPALEAMSRSCPVVVSEAGALPEVVGGAGVLVPVGDAEALAAAAGALLVDPELRMEMAEASRRRAGEFTWAACVDGHLRAYRAAVDTRHPRSGADQ